MRGRRNWREKKCPETGQSATTKLKKRHSSASARGVKKQEALQKACIYYSGGKKEGERGEEEAEIDVHNGIIGAAASADPNYCCLEKERETETKKGTERTRG